jgi:biopolymer transport protein ExbB
VQVIDLHGFIRAIFLGNPFGALIFRALARIERGLPTKLSTSAVDCAARVVVSTTAPAAKSLAGEAHQAIIARPKTPCRPERNGLFSIIQAAGWPIWPLLLCSIAAMALVIERFSSLRAVRVAPPHLLDEVISVTRASLPAADVVNKLEHNSVLGMVLATGLRAVIAEPRITEDALRGAFESAGRVAVHRLERFLNTLGTIASAAPLLGLLGTVIGMIEIFGSQAPTGASNPALLAHGISVALYNTAFGLIIAIPALMFYRYFRGLVDAYTLELEQSSERLVPHLMRFAVPRQVATQAAA